MVILIILKDSTFKVTYNGKYMASSRTQITIRITNINKPQIVSKMADTAICYIHC